MNIKLIKKIISYIVWILAVLILWDIRKVVPFSPLLAIALLAYGWWAIGKQAGQKEKEEELRQRERFVSPYRYLDQLLEDAAAIHKNMGYTPNATKAEESWDQDEFLPIMLRYEKPYTETVSWQNLKNYKWTNYGLQFFKAYDLSGYRKEADLKKAITRFLAERPDKKLHQTDILWCNKETVLYIGRHNIADGPLLQACRYFGIVLMTGYFESYRYVGQTEPWSYSLGKLWEKMKPGRPWPETEKFRSLFPPINEDMAFEWASFADLFTPRGLDGVDGVNGVNGWYI